jgi:hypothetical protein
MTLRIVGVNDVGLSGLPVNRGRVERSGADLALQLAPGKHDLVHPEALQSLNQADDLELPTL